MSVPARALAAATVLASLGCDVAPDVAERDPEPVTEAAHLVAGGGITCTARVICGDAADLLRRPAHGQPETALIGFSCHAGPDVDDLVLLRDALTVSCGAEVTALDPTRGPGHVFGPVMDDPAPGDAVWQYATWVGNALVACGDASCTARSWNVALGFDAAAPGCRLTASAGATRATAPDTAVAPSIGVDLQLTAPGGGLACAPRDGARGFFTDGAAVDVLSHRFDGDALVTEVGALPSAD